MENLNKKLLWLTFENTIEEEFYQKQEEEQEFYLKQLA